MANYKRNLIVGITVLVAMGILGWMILQFGGSIATPFTAAQIRITIVTDRADGISEGSPLKYRGVDVGRVLKVSRGDDMVTIYIDAALDAAPPLPANIDARIRTQGLIGAGAALVLEVTPHDAKPAGRLVSGAKINATFVGLDFLPPEFADLAREFTLTARRFRESGVIDNLNEQITKAGKLLESGDALLNDPKLTENIRTSVDNLRDITASAKRITTRIEAFSEKLDQIGTQASSTLAKTETSVDNLSKQLNDRMAQIATLLDRFQSISAKIDQGQGTAGQLINDPRLYESLVATSQELGATIKDLKRLVEQWEQEGVSLKLK